MKKLIAIVLLSLLGALSAFGGEAANSDLQSQGIVQGYANGDLGLENKINRAEFLKITMASLGMESEGGNCFTDVNEQWYAPYICAAKERGLIKGYADGSFRPEQAVNLLEAGKILTDAFELETSGVVGQEWYSPSLETLAAAGAIPATVDFYTETLIREEAFELLWRVKENQTGESTALAAFKGAACMDFEPEFYENIDMQRVRDTWLSWYNEARAAQGLPAFTVNEQLDRSAYLWSELARSRGYIDHKRPGTTAYYDYYAIQDWFSDLGLTFANVGGITFTENIGRGPYSCSAEDCTDELLAMIRYTFDYYMSEAGQAYRPHYNSLMSGTFKEIGLGLVVSESSYYLTIHYATSITSDPTPFCDSVDY